MENWFAWMQRRGGALVLGLAWLSAACGGEDEPMLAAAVEALNPTDSNEHQYDDPAGTASTYAMAGVVQMTGPFFQTLGTNGRMCFTCHQIDQGWSLTPSLVQARFAATAGNDPLFRPNDGANSPFADLSTESARRLAYSLLLAKAVIRVGLPMPLSRDFDLTVVDDPYGFAGSSELSLFRRPLPSANLRVLSTVMWDGRESAGGLTLDAALLQQASHATTGHAQAAQAITGAQARGIVDFELGITHAQHKTTVGRDMAASGSNGGLATPARYLSTLATYPGINALLGDASTQLPFDPLVFDLYDAWATTLTGTGQKEQARRAILRGQNLFNTRTFTISGVAGFNDVAETGAPSSLVGTCSTCHNVPNAGNNSLPLLMNLGIDAAGRRAVDMPLYTFVQRGTGATRQSTDPGLALVTGRFRDLGRFKVPTLRGLSARPPYFHDGSAATLNNVLGFYIRRFAIALTTEERADLLAFLESL